MKRLLVNDMLNSLGERTLWNNLQDWFDLEFVGGDYKDLAAIADKQAGDASLIIRSASWFPPMQASAHVPTIGLLIEILHGRKRAMQDAVIKTCRRVVVISEFTRAQYSEHSNIVVIPLPVDFELFKPANRQSLAQVNGLPERTVCWVGASQGQEGEIKGYDNFMNIVRETPDVAYVAVFKDAEPQEKLPNLRTHVKISQKELADIIGACRIGLCTSKTETQHLAGIEMGACGLPLVVPPVGAYWQRAEIPGEIVNEGNDWLAAIRHVLSETYEVQQVREFWRSEFDIESVRQKWAKLIEEVESS